MGFTIESRPQVVHRRGRKRQVLAALFILVCLLAALLVSAWVVYLSRSNPQQPTVYGGPRVNGFGSATNHVHSLLVFPDTVLVLATHYGLFRSSNAGKTWSMVAAGPNQLMDGL